MSGSGAADAHLTDEQRLVVEQPLDARVLVTAGPGAGKTHTLIHRLEHLVVEEEVGPGEILVLTFSRAAVRELRDRTSAHGGAVRSIRAQTFDSWALDLLMRVDADGGWAERSFDDRIDGARRAIEDGLAAEAVGDDLLHVVVDEVQDLVGTRREMVEALLDEFGPGFTVVGDPAQSIYGFTVSDAEQRSGETGRFFSWLRNTWGTDLVELELTENFRARSHDAETALPHGPGLRHIAEHGRIDDGWLYEELRGSLRGTLTLGALDEFGCRTLDSYEGGSAVLCRTNGQALVLSELLWAGGVGHHVQRSARERGAPAWLASLFTSTDGALLTRARFDELTDAAALPTAEIERKWAGLVRAAGGRSGSRTIDMVRLRAMLATGRLPDELTARPRMNLVVSSFHRAKGLEFDRVVVVDPGDLPTEDTSSGSKGKGRHGHRPVDTAEEARLLYVAMTRAREELIRLDAPDAWFVRTAPELGRWGRYSFRRWARLGLEIGEGDVHADHPGGVHDLVDDPLDIQEYLRTEVAPGDPVTVERLGPHAIALEASPPYAIGHAGRHIGVMSARFRGDLYRFMKLGAGYEPRNWPRRITGVRVDAVETVVGSEAAGERAGLGAYGVWLAPRLVGLSRFEYDRTNAKENDNGVAQ